MNKSTAKVEIILIIDCNVQRRSNLATKLRLMGHATEVSSSGFHAIHLLEQAKDFKMKNYSGLIIVENSGDMPAREIMLLARNIFDNKLKFPILYLSKNNDPDEILQTIQEGANEYIIDFNNQTKVLDKVSKHIPL